MNIDWSNAPDGATHYLATDKNPWRMVHEDGARFAYIDNEWIVITNPVPFTEYISRPTAPNWSGGHVDASPSYPMGEQASDYAVSPWNGEGLPPVGTVCEWRDDDEGRWSKVEVRYLSEHTALLRFQGATGDIEGAFEPNHCQFRPLRTPEQIRDEVVRRMANAIKDCPTDLDRAAVLYMQGYRKTEG
ncbi:hypothetical protein [Pseudomonas sp.]|uniref:hypothetical protein n=1 Tax=Pseudomonas sp. TaxID=306 RepID=UPI0028971A7F|nr:hypothetical protein [Pseudomonas sp.]